MPNRYSANLAALMPAFQQAQQFAQGLQSQQQQAQEMEYKKELLELQKQQQKLKLDALKQAQREAQMQEKYRDLFTQSLNPQGATPAQPPEPTGAAEGAPRGSSLDANQELMAQAQQSAMNPRTQAMQQGVLAERAGMGEMYRSFLQQGLLGSGATASPFETLVRQGMKPQEALELVEDIKADDKIRIAQGKPPKPRQFGQDREAISEALYDKAFIELSGQQQKDVNRRVIADRQAVMQENLKNAPLPSTARTKLTLINSLKDSTNELKAAFRPEFVGKLNAVGNKLRIASGQASPELTAFVSLHTNLIDMLARERTGAVIGAQEAATFASIIGSTFDSPDVFLARLNRFERTLEMQEDNVFELNLKSASELNEERLKKRRRQKQNSQSSQSNIDQQIKAVDDEIAKLEAELKALGVQ